MSLDPRKAPWSNQPVSAVARAGAWFFVLCGVFALTLTTYSLLTQGGTAAPVWFVLFFYAVGTYFVWLFGHVAFCGRAPAGWLPSWRKSDDN